MLYERKTFTCRVAPTKVTQEEWDRIFGPPLEDYSPEVEAVMVMVRESCGHDYEI